MRNLLLLLGILTLASCKKEVVAKAIPDPEPMKVYSANGISVKSYDFNRFEPFLKRDSDTTYVINFWATWCQPCIAELPHFEKLQSEHKGQKVKVILVSMDMAKEAESRLIPYIQKKNLHSKVILLNDPDADAWISKVDANWSGAIPATVIYNKGKRQFYEQSFTYVQLNEQLNQFIQ